MKQYDIIENFPLFPLSLVAFPGEQLKLHIFEPRYRQLIGESIEQGTPFGIPAVIDGKLSGYGTIMTVDTLVNTYQDGKMDIVTRGTGWFELLEYDRMIPGKLYPGGTIKVQGWDDISDIVLTVRLKALISELYEIMNITNVILESDQDFRTYQIAHRVGLNVEQELEFLKTEKETDRQGYLIRHLEYLIPIVRQAEDLRRKAELNGHFASLSLPDF